MSHYNNIIIGGGIAGLYTAYNIKKKYPKETYIILEKNDRIGGRNGNFDFYGVPVNIGAGIGRYEKDVLLKQLLSELKIKYNKFTVNSQFSNVWKAHCNIMQVIKLLKKEYNLHKTNTTFKKFALSKIDKTLYDCFRKSTAYSDF
jgi:cation diffusion facilitator CzcD-associated flavoprotein CzcO